MASRRAQRPVLGQRYRLIRQIDAGGMGSVWLAEAVHLRSLVAVKIMDQALAATPEAAQRFMHEARTAASLRSPHVVQILDYGVHESTPFIAMELLEGESLATRLRREGRLASFEQTELVLRHVARALARAHDAGVIHRDLKPGNIFLVRDEDEEIVKLLDFGIAKTTVSPLGAPLHSDTRTGEFLGSPAYASPEQLQASKAVDHRADIWSLGVIAYQCMLGQQPFAADNFVALLLTICTGPIPVPSEQGPVPPGFDAWFARACARDVEQRFQSVREASAELRRLVTGAGGAAALAVPALPPAATAPALPEASAAASLSAGSPPEALSDAAQSDAAQSDAAQSDAALSDGVPFELKPSDGAPPPSPDAEPTALARRPATAPMLAAPPADGEPTAFAPRPPTAPMLAAPMELDAPPSPVDWPLVEPRTPRTDTMPLVAQQATKPRRRAATLTLLLALPAIAALVFVTLDASSSRAAFDWRRFTLRAPTPTERAATPERAGAPASDPAASVAEGPTAMQPSQHEPSPELEPTTSGEAAPPAPSASAHTLAAGLVVLPENPSDEPEGGGGVTREAVVPARGVPEPAPAPSSRPSSTASAPRPSSTASAPRPSSSARASDVARLTLTASAPAEVLLDGVPLGTTPLESIRVQPGTHEVTFIQDGKRSAETLTLRSGEHKRVEARSDPPPGDGLNEAAVKRTIKAHRDAVVDDCWDYAFGARAPGIATSIRVPVSIEVEPSGTVRSVVTRAEPPGHSALRRCVEDRVAEWRFPPARAETVVNVAFVFVDH